MTTRTITVEALAAADHAWSRLNGHLHCAHHYVPVRPCTVEDHMEWATDLLAALPAEPAGTPLLFNDGSRVFPAEPAGAGLPAADPDDFVLQGYKPWADDFGNQYLERPDTNGICHHCGQQMIEVLVGPSLAAEPVGEEG